MIAMDEFLSCLHDVAMRMEHVLESLLNAHMGKDMGSQYDRLATAMRYGVLGGGKRIRPFLVIETARLFGHENEAINHAAAAVEYIHCYSLIHDDLPAMDNDDMRRGRPTVHKAFDEATAILAGDGLLTLAFEILSDPHIHADPNRRVQMISTLAKAIGPAGMVQGQMLDLAAEGRFQDMTDTYFIETVETVRHIQALKTGALIKTAIEIGVILANASIRDRQKLSLYGDHIGLAFQLADDLLDAEGDASAVGKAIGKDSAAGKATFVRLYGVEETRRKLTELTDQAEAILDPFGNKAKTLKGLAQFICQRTF